jgi:predicted transposase/invertase (TIGR01784 family)
VKKGREEGREALIRTAKNLLTMGLSIENVVKATGLSEAQVREMAG